MKLVSYSVPNDLLKTAPLSRFLPYLMHHYVSTAKPGPKYVDRIDAKLFCLSNPFLSFIPMGQRHCRPGCRKLRKILIIRSIQACPVKGSRVSYFTGVNPV